MIDEERSQCRSDESFRNEMKHCGAASAVELRESKENKRASSRAGSIISLHSINAAAIA